MNTVCLRFSPKHVECARLCKEVYTKRSDILIRHNKPNREVIIAVEGTDTLINWYDNLSVCKRTDDVHIGFRKYATYCKKRYRLRIELQKYKEDKIYMCGHSLGSAAAALLASDFEGEYDIELVLFGCPKIGGNEFITNFASKSIPTFDYKTKHDVVTKLPFNALGYVQLTDDVIELSPEYKPYQILKNHDIDTYIDELEKYMDRDTGYCI